MRHSILKIDSEEEVLVNLLNFLNIEVVLSHGIMRHFFKL